VVVVLSANESVFSLFSIITERKSLVLANVGVAKLVISTAANTLFITTPVDVDNLILK
jgi:hypothetical protein